ncbi:MAG: EAL domain-containing protein [Pseudomonadota bacterium]
MKKSTQTLNLAAFHDSINDTLELASLLRNAGVPAQAKHLEELPNLFEMLRTEPVDIVLHLHEITEPSLNQVVKAIRAQYPEIPILSMSGNFSVDMLNQAISEGADDLINLDNPKHVLHVLKREAQRIQCARRLVKLEAIQQESERRCKSLIQSSRDAIAYIHGGMHIDANDVYLQTLGFNSVEDMEGSPLLDLVESKDHAKIRELMRSELSKTDEVQSLENIHFKHQDGSIVIARVEFSPATIDGEPCTQVLIRLTSDADTKALEEKITRLSQRDPITGLLNRQYYLEELGKKLVLAREQHARFVLIHLQVSYAQEIRNKIGVVGRDAIISEAGRILERSTSDNALLSLYSSNVFTILEPSNDPSHQATFDRADALAKNLVHQVSQHIFEAGGQSVTVDCTAGVIVLDEHSPQITELLRRAERVSAEAGEKPSGAVLFFKPEEINASLAEKDEYWNRLLKDALINKQFRLLFQPILSLAGDVRRQRYEVFLRLQDEQRNLVEPKDFIASAERSGISVDIDRYVIQGAIRNILESRKRGLNLQFFVRISTPTLLDADFYPWFSSQLMDAQIYDGGIVLQIHENVASEQLKQVQSLVENLQRVHSSLLIDGVGSNDPVNQLLTRLDIQWVRIDPSIAHNLNVQKANQTRMTEVIKTLKLRDSISIIVPHIENAATLQIVSMSGADYLQGNFIQGLSDRLDFDFNSF